jgi:threonylcarbamoyladenosine tRNA methylthiotransferase MtaB
VSAVDGVDIVAGTNEKSKMTQYVAEFKENRIKQLHIKGYEELDAYDEMGTVASADARTRAYIKIQEGCNRFCAYCVIPYARGKVRSRCLEDILDEAKQLIESGYKEIVLTGINTALYEMENEHQVSEEPYGVEKVIAALDAMEGDFRIRLSSLEPAVVNAEYVKRLLKYDKLCHHIHLSAQSGSDSVLEGMNRPYDRSEYMDIVKVLKDADPYYGISTDIIVGFPGEKEKHFEESCSLVEECGFCKTHIFKYSKRPMTKAAKMDGHIAPEVKNRRSDKLHKVGAQAAKVFFDKNKGRKERVLLEEIYPEKNVITGYAGNYTKVYIKYESEDEAMKLINEFVDVILLDTFEEGMTAKLV